MHAADPRNAPPQHAQATHSHTPAAMQASASRACQLQRAPLRVDALRPHRWSCRARLAALAEPSSWKHAAASAAPPLAQRRASTHVAHAYASTGRSGPMSRYAEPGPHRTATFPYQLALGVSQQSSAPLSMKLEIIHPVGLAGQRAPLAIVSPGFLLDSDTFRWGRRRSGSS